MTVATAPSALTRADAEDFLFHEADLLDRRDYEAWLDLFAEDGIYWLPANEADIDPTKHVSIVYDDVNRLRIRVERLRSGKAYAQEPASRICHVIGNVRVEAGTGDETLVRSNLAVFEARLGKQKAFFAGACAHRLRSTDDGLRIVEKRLVLIDNDQYMREIAFIV